MRTAPAFAGVRSAIVLVLALARLLPGPLLVAARLLPGSLLVAARRLPGPQRVLAGALSGILLAGVASAQERAPDPGGLAARGVQIPVEFAEGLRVVAVSVRLDGSTGDAAQDTAIVRRIEELGNVVRDAPLQRMVVDGLVQRVAALERIATATYAVYESVPAGRAVVVVTAVPTTAPKDPAADVKGMLVSGDAKAFPLLYQDDKALATLILNGGVGAYATSNPFFGYANLFTKGNIAAPHPAGPGTTSWTEAYIEPGIGGITRLGDSPFYAYGRATYLVSASWGQDVYDSGNRHHGAFEQAYAGLLWDLPGKGTSLNVSAGRQIYQLRQGFLISKIPGSTNLGPLGALWLGPRLAFKQTVVADLKYGPFLAEGILLEPTEFPGMETNTRLVGGTVGYDNGDTVDAAFTYLQVPRSQKPYLAPDGSVLGTREGLTTVSPSVWLTRLFGVDGLWFKTEFAYQTHDTIDMSAYAFALWPGYRAEQLPWKPGISYRYSMFSGDNPATATYERYDPLLSGGQSNYVPGMLLSGVLLNSNLSSHRVTLTANPSDQVALTLEYTLHRANTLNNRGAIGPLQTLSSKDLAQEVDFFANVYIGKHFYVQGVLGAAVPGAAIRDAVGGPTKNWYAAQLSLYMFF